YTRTRSTRGPANARGRPSCGMPRSIAVASAFPQVLRFMRFLFIQPTAVADPFHRREQVGLLRQADPARPEPAPDVLRIGIMPQLADLVRRAGHALAHRDSA